MSTSKKSSGMTLFVANDGNDTWSGRISASNADATDGPFATLERARDEIRNIKQLGEIPEGGVTVELRGGVYQREQPFELSEEDSGNENAPVMYRAQQGEEVRLLGGKLARRRGQAGRRNQRVLVGICRHRTACWGRNACGRPPRRRRRPAGSRFKRLANSLSRILWNDKITVKDHFGFVGDSDRPGGCCLLAGSPQRHHPAEFVQFTAQSRAGA